MGDPRALDLDGDGVLEILYNDSWDFGRHLLRASGKEYLPARAFVVPYYGCRC